MSSKDGRLDSGQIHLFVIEITIDKDSCEQVARTIGSTIFFRPSRLLRDACKKLQKYDQSISIYGQKEGMIVDSSIY